MFYIMTELGTAVGTNHIYVRAIFWESKQSFDRGQPPYGSTNFQIGRNLEGSRIVEDERGWHRAKKGPLGLIRYWVDPGTLTPETDTDHDWVRKKYVVDIAAAIRAKVESTLKQYISDGRTGDTSEPRWRHDNSDPLRILVRPEVQALRNVGIEIM